MICPRSVGMRCTPRILCLAVELRSNFPMSILDRIAWVNLNFNGAKRVGNGRIVSPHSRETNVGISDRAVRRHIKLAAMGRPLRPLLVAQVSFLCLATQLQFLCSTLSFRLTQPYAIITWKPRSSIPISDIYTLTLQCPIAIHRNLKWSPKLKT